VRDRNRVCPNCGIQLQYRLGTFECPDCDYSEPEHPPEPESQPEPKQKLRNLPKWIPPVTLHDPGLESGTVFNPREYDEHARISTATLGQVAQLVPEKAIVLGAMAVRSVLEVILISPMYGTVSFVFGSATVVLSILCVLVSLLLWAWVFFSRVVWAKIVFSILALVYTAILIGGVLTFLYFVLSDKRWPWLVGVLPFGFLFWVVTGINAIIFGWAFWILAREIQILQYRG
jgi:hypothetical protein